MSMYTTCKIVSTNNAGGNSKYRLHIDDQEYMIHLHETGYRAHYFSIHKIKNVKTKKYYPQLNIELDGDFNLNMMQVVGNFTITMKKFGIRGVPSYSSHRHIAVLNKLKIEIANHICAHDSAE